MLARIVPLPSKKASALCTFYVLLMFTCTFVRLCQLCEQVAEHHRLHDHHLFCRRVFGPFMGFRMCFLLSRLKGQSALLQEPNSHHWLLCHHCLFSSSRVQCQGRTFGKCWKVYFLSKFLHLESLLSVQVTSLRGVRFIQIFQMVRLDFKFRPWRMMASVVYSQRIHLAIVFYMGFLALLLVSFVIYFGMLLLKLSCCWNLQKNIEKCVFQLFQWRRTITRASTVWPPQCGGRWSHCALLATVIPFRWLLQASFWLAFAPSSVSPSSLYLRAFSALASL